jgi:DNA-binding MarR family transcriptional regulator|tara:strand:+ start:198 stop:662 length:465 start_codon:yes stop_codon:yes gene_type:complete
LKIEQEIEQENFDSEQQRLLINIMFTGNQFTLLSSRMLKQFSLTTQQFNVLRILRGQKGNPISVKDMHGRMLDSSSNVSRLVDKLLTKNLITRITCPNDRRKVELTIPKKGLQLLSEIDVFLKVIKKRLRSAITEDEAKIASRILDKFRIINQI